MRFEYVPYNGNWLPLIPVAFRTNQKRLPFVHALVDTGATQSILPAELATELGIHLDLESSIEAQVAGGGRCLIYPSPSAIEYVVKDPESQSEHRWKGPVFFALGQQFALLGHEQCLSKFDITFKGPERCLDLVPRFRTTL
jgi:hypothetical protein